MKNRLEIKILLLIIVVLVAGFGTYVVVSITRESKILLEQQREKSRLFGETVMVGIRNVMLSGKAPFAAELVNDARENLQFGTLRVYNNKSKEVFPDEGRGVITNTGDQFVKKALDTQAEVMFMKQDSAGNRVVRIEPLLNDRECQRCHSGNHLVRGVTQLELNPDLMITHTHSTEIHDHENAQLYVAELISNTLSISFRNIMLAGEGALMDTLVERASRLPFVERIKIYDRFGAVHFGDEQESVPDDSVMRTMETARPIIFAEKHRA
ncbi:MAG: hypothetical protein PHP42_12110, partial [Bacteroidota bacterium]|nr:hypothetical protein [Bacteroidota bacterium]